MIKTISMRIDNESNEDDIFFHLKKWVLLNFQLTTDVSFEVSGKEKTIRFNMKDHWKNIKEIKEVPKKNVISEETQEILDEEDE